MKTPYLFIVYITVLTAAISATAVITKGDTKGNLATPSPSPSPNPVPTCILTKETSQTLDWIREARTLHQAWVDAADKGVVPKDYGIGVDKGQYMTNYDWDKMWVERYTEMIQTIGQLTYCEERD